MSSIIRRGDLPKRHDHRSVVERLLNSFILRVIAVIGPMPEHGELLIQI